VAPHQKMPRHIRPPVLLAILLLTASLPLAAQAPKSRLGPDGAPVWNRMFHLPDGRTFVTDGAIMLDAALAKPAALPAQVLPESTGKVMAKHMAAPLEHEYPLARLAAGKPPRS